LNDVERIVSKAVPWESLSSVKDVFVHINCPVCGGERFKTVWRSTPGQFLNDFRKSYYNLDALGIGMNTGFCIKKCRDCRFVFVNPRLRSDLYDVVYNEAKVQQNRDKQWIFQECDLKYLYHTHHKWAAARILMRSLSYLHTRFEKPKNENQRRIRLLDYGCGYGHLLDLCRVFGIEAIGVDIDLYRIQFCRDKGLNVSKPEELDAATKFDVVISTSVVEHVNDLHGYFQYLSDRLESGGYLHLIGLNPTIIRREKSRGEYRLVMPLEHLNYFTPGSLEALAAKYGLRRIKVSHLFQPTTKPLDYFTPFLKNFVFRGFYPTGVFEADLTKL
jgi:2-polyprenyl-3-methyl-5-hydroxy-6-metoxy-1,4-benzoquinol methylase